MGKYTDETFTTLIWSVIFIVFIYITPKEQELSGKLNEGEHAKSTCLKNSSVSLKWQQY